MILFLLLFFTVYGGLNAYVLAKFQSALRLGPWSSLLLAAILFVLLLMPLSLRLIARPGLFEVARVAAFAGYLWLAIVLWFCCIGIIMDLVNFAGFLLHAGGAGPLIPARVALAINVGAILVLLVVAIRENRVLRIETVPVFTERMPAGTPELRVAQVSDLHYSLVGGSLYLAQMSAELQSLKPDLVLATGDILDVTGDLARPLEIALAGIVAPLGKYAVLGNHEFYMGANASVRHMAKAGFKVLREEMVTLDAGGWQLQIAGVDDPAGRYTGQEPLLDEAAVLSDEADRPFTILMKHQPRIEPDSRGRFDLQVSGHTHGGQIFPFQIGVYLTNPYFRGLYPVREGGMVYISRGAGSWGPPLRLLAPREITLFLIRPKPE